MDAITITGICIAAALFLGATAAAWKAKKLQTPVLYISIAISIAFITVSILRMNNPTTTLIATHAVLAVIFIILAKNNLTTAIQHFIKPKKAMKDNNEELKFQEYSNAIHNLQGKVANGIPLKEEEKLLLEYYIEWVREYKLKQNQSKQKTISTRR